MVSEVNSAEIHISDHQALGLAQAPGHLLGKGMSALFSFESLFLLFLFAGRYKAAEWLQWVPVDLTALFFCLSILSGLLILRRRRFKVRRDALALALLALAFVTYCVISLAWSPGRVYARQKAFFIATLTLWPLVACALIIGHDRSRLRRFVVLLVVFSTWLAAESVMARMQRGGRGSISVLGGNYLGAGRTIGLGALSTLAFGLFFAQSRLQNTIAALFFGFLVVTLSVLGGRGPFLATIAGGLVPLLLGLRVAISGQLKGRRYAVKLLVVSGVVIILAACIVLLAHTLPWTFARLRNLSLEDGSAAKRLGWYRVAIQLWQQRPFEGHGIGSFPVLVVVSDSRLYPHNLVLEILAELGIFGMLLFAAVVWFALKDLGPLNAIRADPWRLLVAMFFANAVFNAMISGDIPDNRVLFAVLGLMAFARHDRETRLPRLPAAHNE